jgi:DNA-binding transcriptional ArsR family regulator
MKLRTSNILKSLADETRLSLVRKLVAENREVRGSEMITSCSEALKLSQPALSHHFSRLVQSGVFIERKVGVEKRYRLDYKLLQSIGLNPKKL